MRTQLFGRYLAIAGGVAAAAAVAVSIYLNPPSAVKAHSLDGHRLQSLRQIDMAVKGYYRGHQVLPDRLDAMRSNGSLAARWDWNDPVTHRSYEYEVVTKTAYRLCADFSADSDEEESRYGPAFRKHHKGHDCFQQDVNGE